MKCLELMLWVCVLTLIKCDDQQPDATNSDDDNNTQSTSEEDLLVADNLSWSCANNATCVQAISHKVLDRLRSRQPIELAGIRVEPLPPGGDDGDQVVAAATTTGEHRSLSMMDVISGNSLKVPLGPMLISVQRSRRYADYLELALLKKDASEQHGKHTTTKPNEHACQLITHACRNCGGSSSRRLGPVLVEHKISLADVWAGECLVCGGWALVVCVCVDVRLLCNPIHVIRVQCDCPSSVDEHIS